MSIIYRYGVSLLSRTNHTVAENEELMVDKETGQILLKRKDGKIMSYDAMARFTQSVDRIRAAATSQLLFGKLWAVCPENRSLPSAFDNNEEILSGAETVHLGPTKKLLLQLDVDAYDNESLFGESKSFNDVKVKVAMNVGGTEQVKEFSLLQLNHCPLEFDERVDLEITSIQIEDQEVDSTTHFVLNNILAVTV